MDDSSTLSSSLSWHSSSAASQLIDLTQTADDEPYVSESSEVTDVGRFYDRLRLEFLESAAEAPSSSPLSAAPLRDTTFDDRLLLWPANSGSLRNWQMMHAVADLLLVRAREAIDAGRWGEASQLLAPLVVSRLVEFHRALSTEVFGTVMSLFWRSWSPQQQQQPHQRQRDVERFAHLFWAYSANNTALLTLVCHKMALRRYKEALILLQERLFGQQVMRTTFLLLGALLAHRAWCDERRLGPFTRREFDQALDVPTNVRVDLNSPPHELLGVTLHLLQTLVRNVEPTPPPAAEPPDEQYLSAVFTPVLAEPERIAATWELRERPPEVRFPPADSEDDGTDDVRFDSDGHRKRKRRKRRKAPPKPRAIPLHRSTAYVEPPLPMLEAVAIEHLSEIYESFSLFVKAEALLRSLLTSQPNSASAAALLFAFWQRRPTGNDDALQRLALRLFELDPTHLGAFVFVRARCGDPGPNRLGSRDDVLCVALRRVGALVDDAPTWLWLVRLTLQWRRELNDDSAHEFYAFWLEQHQLVADALVVPPRQRSLSVSEHDYYALLYQLVFAEQIAPVLLHAARFANVVYAVLHPLDTDPAFRARVIARVHAEALHSP